MPALIEAVFPYDLQMCTLLLRRHRVRAGGDRSMLSGLIQPARRITRPRPLVVCLVVLLAVLLLGCGGRDYLTPEVAGVVVGREGGAGGTATWELATGQTYSLEMTSSDVIEGQGGSPDVGDLLLGGTGPDGAWVASLFEQTGAGTPPDCYALHSFGTDRGEWIETDVGLRLPKAPEFDPGTIRDVKDGVRYEDTLPEFCVNPAGQVTSFR